MALFDWHGVVYLITPVVESPIDYEILDQRIRSLMLYNDQNFLRHGEELLGRPLSTEETRLLLEAKSECDKKSTEFGSKRHVFPLTFFGFMYKYLFV